MRSPNFGPANPEFRGKLREADVFGYPKWEESLKQTARKEGAVPHLDAYRTYQEFKSGRYVPYREALAFVQDAYPLDPHNPQKPFAKELRIEIADKLGLQTTEEMRRIKLYSTLNSPIDRFHGVDAIVVYDDPKYGTIRVTIDETENTQKIGAEHKADILMYGVTAEPEDETKFLQSVGLWADEIAAKIEKKREEIAKAQRKPH